MLSSNYYTDFLQAINRGYVCVFETDTVVGIGCKIIVDNKANSNIKKIFKIKNRSKSKPLPLLISSESMARQYCSSIPKYAKEYVKDLWPGNTTLIFKSNQKINNDLIISHNESSQSIAFRVPAVKELICVITEIDCPIATTSANFSGEPAVSSIKDVSSEFLNFADFVYTKPLNRSNNNKASQIISCTDNQPIIIRQ